MVLLHEKYQLKCIVQYWPLNRAELFQQFGFSKAEVPHTDRFHNNVIIYQLCSYIPCELVDAMAGMTRQAIKELRS